MVEDRGSFFEGSRHTLLALQKMMREPYVAPSTSRRNADWSRFPLSEHLVDAQRKIETPQYVQENPHKDLSSILPLEETMVCENINILENWPTTALSSLDESQSNALQRVLTKRLPIVQGPPGTGKTYISVVALKIMLSNMQPTDPPIIVTCQTNHALDQLLRHIAEFESRFVRLGGRSKDKDVVKKRTLFEVRQQSSRPSSSGASKLAATKQIKSLAGQMQRLLAPLEANKPLLDHRLLRTLGILTAQQAESLELGTETSAFLSSETEGIQMDQWLGRMVVRSDRPIQPDTFGFDTYDEEDFELEQVKELEAEAVAQDDEDFEVLRGPVTNLCDNLTGRVVVQKSDEEIRAILEKTTDLNTIQQRFRGTVYRYFQRQAKLRIRGTFRELAAKFANAVHRRRMGQWEDDHQILKSQRVVGLTTTGLSKYRALICSLKPKVILVEEAAETLEAPIAAACLPSLQQLILVGDHKQLRPHCNLRDLENEPYHFNLSLFERLVMNHVEYDTLATQRRMIPEIRRLLKPIYGKALLDHPTVQNTANREPVPGMGGCNSFFFTHEWPESRDEYFSSRNAREAEMVVGFFNYLVFNEVPVEKITVLTFYHGQRKAIIKGLRTHPDLRSYLNFKVVTVDSYQGEENDIVILSLVRSNDNHKIGFLDVDNRVCVALSRARCGFYMFGNGELLCCESKTWSDVIEIMFAKKGDHPTTGPKKRLGFSLPLQCKKHGRKVFIQGEWHSPDPPTLDAVG